MSLSYCCCRCWCCRDGQWLMKLSVEDVYSCGGPTCVWSIHQRQQVAPRPNAERLMMHRQQRQTSTILRSSSSLNSSSGSSSSDYSSPLTILSRRCPLNRSRTSTTSTSAASPSSRCSSSRATSSSSSSCPVLLSVVAWSVTLLLISSTIGIADAGARRDAIYNSRLLTAHPLGKRSFMELQCKGIYDKSIFARLDRVCEDCYNLFREPQLHTLCRKNCFTSDYFKGCVDVLLLQDEMPQIKKWIKQLHGADPGV